MYKISDIPAENWKTKSISVESVSTDVIEDLEPLTEYIAVVKVEHKDGKSDKSNEIHFCTHGNFVFVKITFFQLM